MTFPLKSKRILHPSGGQNLEVELRKTPNKKIDHGFHLNPLSPLESQRMTAMFHGESEREGTEVIHSVGTHSH